MSYATSPKITSIENKAGLASAKGQAGNAEFLDVASGDLEDLLKEYPAAFDHSHFTHQSYLRNLQCDRYVVVERTGSKESQPLLFADFGTHFVGCNRLEPITAREIERVCEALFALRPRCFIEFQDVIADDTKLSFPRFSFNYQRNWFRHISPEENYLSKRRRSVLRRRMRKLLEHANAEDVAFEFRQAIDQDIDAVVSLNERSFAAQNRKYIFSKDKQDTFKKTARDIGYAATLRVNETLIAVDVLTIIDDEAWFVIGGYDLDYQEFSPGMQLHSMIIEECTKRGVSKVNFLWGDSPWKTDVSGIKEELTTVFVARSPDGFISPAFATAVYPHARQSLKLKCMTLLQKLGLRK